MNNPDILQQIILSSDYNSALKLLSVINPSVLSIHKALLELKEKEICPFCHVIDAWYALDANSSHIWLEQGSMCHIHDILCTSCGGYAKKHNMKPGCICCGGVQCTYCIEHHNKCKDCQ